MRYCLWAVVLLLHLDVWGQSKRIFGVVTDSDGAPLSGVTVAALPHMTLTNDQGEYELIIDVSKHKYITFKSLGFKSDSISSANAPRDEWRVNMVLQPRTNFIAPVEVVAQEADMEPGIQLGAKDLQFQTGPLGGVESLIRSLPGVIGVSEFSSQYNVRGGNFDENLVYVNGIEVYRPFLVRAGEQEGLSFVNSSMTGNIRFSAGGFEARYGDKLSSVLDITYRRPRQFEIGGEVSFLGGGLTVGGTSRDERFSILAGARYRVNTLLVGSLDTEADFRPEFTDIQLSAHYQLSTRWELSFLGNYARNIYKVVPTSRTTDFGTVTEALRLNIFFEGQETYRYNTFFGALQTKYLANENLTFTLTGSAYQTVEEEYFDILGFYRLGELDNNLGSDDFGEIKFLRGVGGFQNYARNNLDVIIANLEWGGEYRLEEHTFTWGLKGQVEDIVDRYKEWERIDSAGYSIPHSPSATLPGVTPVVPAEGLPLFESFDTRGAVVRGRMTAFLQWSRLWNTAAGRWMANAGVRTNTWGPSTLQTVVSPRGQLSFRPAGQPQNTFRLSGGWYHQPPLYREMRNLAGELNLDLRAQESIHLVGGFDREFTWRKRPFKWTVEAYYKWMNDLVPYELDNVRLRYSAVNDAVGFATGIDTRLYGEFVKGIDSWASMGLMTVQEDIANDGVGWIPRPTDRRFSFAVQFQDYLPKDPSFRVSINLTLATGLPFGAPQTPRAEQTLRMPAYRRVDIGFIKVFKEEGQVKQTKWLNAFRTLYLNLEVFNLFDTRNTVSYLWVRDVSTSRQYAVPNYLTGRLLNLRLVFGF